MSADRLDLISDTPPTDGQAKLEYNSLYHKHRRKNRRENSINWCFVIFIWICSIGLCAIVAVKIVYTVCPSAIFWLKDEQIAKINEFFVEGGIGGLVVYVFKSKILEKKDEEF